MTGLQRDESGATADKASPSDDQQLGHGSNERVEWYLHCRMQLGIWIWTPLWYQGSGKRNCVDLRLFS